MSPFVGYLNYKIPSKILIVLGIIGYGVYSIGMILFPNIFVFYALQVFIGLAAAFYFVSFRNILVNSQTQNAPRAFGFFY
ncbi:hypothetical protein HRbin34_00343 [bacterium HR34]|nr:hypothetical protein HRbin34_00343 [bacterium HR34]